jgi:hypothetical protein
VTTSGRRRRPTRGCMLLASMCLITLATSMLALATAVGAGGPCNLESPIATRNQPALKALLDGGCNPNASLESGGSALWLAFTQRNLEALHLLLARGADPRVRDRVDGRTLLHDVAGSGDVALAQLLVDKGADVDARDSGGATAPHI